MPFDAVDVEWFPDEEAITCGVVISGQRKMGEDSTPVRQIVGDLEGEDG